MKSDRPYRKGVDRSTVRTVAAPSQKAVTPSAA